MKTSPRKSKWKQVALLLLVGIVALIVFPIIHQRKLPPTGEWFHKMNRDMDEISKSNGLVKVGDNTWELPGDGQTNAPTIDKTNTANQEPPAK
jgi:membrane protein implicated in regulation of membrane protease activity